MQKVAFAFLDLLRAQRLQIASAFGVQPAGDEADAEWGRRTIRAANETGRLEHLSAMIQDLRPIANTAKP